MPEGPLGGPRPFAEQNCSPLLSVHITVIDNRWKLSSPEGMNDLTSTIAESTKYMERSIYLREAEGRAEGYDFYGYVEVTLGEYFNSVAQSVDQMEKALKNIEGVGSVNVTLDAGDPEQKIREY